MYQLDQVTYQLFGIDPAKFYATRFADPGVFNPLALTPLYKRTIGFQKFDSIINEFSEVTNGSGDGRVLDFGCGSGRFGAYLKSKYPNIHLTGIDMSAACLRQAKIHQYDVTLEGDLTKRLPFPDQYFDFIYSMDVFGHIEFKDKDAVIKELKRVTRVGGGGFHGIEAGYIDYQNCQPLNENDAIRRYVFIDGHIGVEPIDTITERFEQELTVTKSFHWLLKPVLESKNAIDHKQWGEQFSADIEPHFNYDAEMAIDAVLGHFNSTQLQILINSFGPIMTQRRLKELVPLGAFRDYLLELTGWGGFAMVSTRR